MKLSDLIPNRRFPEPAVPDGVGPDAAIFRAYARIVRYYEERGKIKEWEGKEQRDRVRSLDCAHNRYWLKFMTTPAKTLQGVCLKLEYCIASEIISEDGHLFDYPAFVYSAVEDLKTMIAATADGPKASTALAPAAPHHHAA